MQKLHTTLSCADKSMWAGPTTRGPNRNYFWFHVKHFVDEFYDHGEIISQKTFKIEDNDTIETVKNKVKRLEKKYFNVLKILNLNQHKN